MVFQHHFTGIQSPMKSNDLGPIKSSHQVPPYPTGSVVASHLAGHAAAGLWWLLHGAPWRVVEKSHDGNAIEGHPLFPVENVFHKKKQVKDSQS